jgi:hypothetical protein
MVMKVVSYHPFYVSSRFHSNFGLHLSIGVEMLGRGNEEEQVDGWVFNLHSIIFVLASIHENLRDHFVTRFGPKNIMVTLQKSSLFPRVSKANPGC